MSLRAGIIENARQGDSITVEPTVEPISSTEVKLLLGIPAAETQFDSLIDIQIKAARRYVEQMTGLAFITQTWLMTLDYWPATSSQWWDGVRDGSINDLLDTMKDVPLSKYPLQSVSSLTVDSVAYVVSDYFEVDTTQKPGRLKQKFGVTVPVPVTETAASIQITYVSGFGPNAANVPNNIRLGLMQMVAMLFSHRGDGCSIQSAYIDSGCQDLVSADYARRL